MATKLKTPDLQSQAGERLAKLNQRIGALERRRPALAVDALTDQAAAKGLDELDTELEGLRSERERYRAATSELDRRAEAEAAAERERARKQRYDALTTQREALVAEQTASLRAIEEATIGLAEQCAGVQDLTRRIGKLERELAGAFGEEHQGVSAARPQRLWGFIAWQLSRTGKLADVPLPATAVTARPEKLI